MKKLFIFLGLVILVLIASLVLFVATFNADRYKGLAAARLEKLLGKPVTIGHIGFKWQNGAAIEVSDLAVYANAAEKSVPWIRLERAHARIGSFFPLSLVLRDGHVLLHSLSDPDRADFEIKNLSAEASVNGEEIFIGRLTADAAGGALEFSGKISKIRTQPELMFKGSVKDFPLDQLVKNTNPNAPRVAGHLTLSIDGRAQGLVWETISKTLNGRARILMKDGVFLNYNLLKEVMDKISTIPGAGEAIQANFPQKYRLRLEDTSTLLKPVDLGANIANGVFDFDPLQIETDFVLLSGAGKIGLDRHLDARANLILNQEISQAFVGAFDLIRLLCNNRGEMVVPVTARGELPQIKIMPDTKYIKSRLLSGTTQQIVESLVSDPHGGLDTIQALLKKNLKGIKI